MNHFSTQLTKALSQGYSIDEIIRQEIETTINQLLRTELTVFLDYERYDPIGYNSGNSRNGSYTRQFQTKYGEITVEVPRDRNGEFTQQTIPSYKRRSDDLETTILQLYSKGITTSEIADLIEKMYGHAYTTQTISNITQVVEEHVEAFHQRTLNKRYIAIYCDATHLNVRRDSVSKEALHILVGITQEGTKEVLDYRLFPQESCANYREMFEDIKARGVNEVLLFVSDGLTGIRDVCLEIYPQALHQSCWVHIQRNIARLVRAKDRKEILELLKPVYQADSQLEAQATLKHFTTETSNRYPKVIKLLDQNPSLLSFLSFPKSIRRSIYTTNILEGMNKQIKRYTKRKEQFPNEASLDRFVCNQLMEYNQRFSSRVHLGFNLVHSEIDEMFENQY